MLEGFYLRMITPRFTGMTRVLESDASRKKRLADNPAYQYSYPHQIRNTLDEVTHNDAKLGEGFTAGKLADEDEFGMTPMFAFADVVSVSAEGKAHVKGEAINAGVVLTQGDAIDFWVSQFPGVFTRQDFEELAIAKEEYHHSIAEAEKIPGFYTQRLAQASGIPIEEFEAYDKAMLGINAQMTEAFQQAFDAMRPKSQSVVENLAAIEDDSTALDAELERFQDETSAEAELQ